MLGEGFSGGARLAADWAEELRRRGLPLERALWLRWGKGGSEGRSPTTGKDPSSSRVRERLVRQSMT